LHNLREAVQAAVASQTTPWGQLRAALRTHLAISVQYQDFAIVLLKDLRHLSAEQRTHVVAARDAYEDMWQGLLEACQAAGLFRPGVDLDLLRLMAFGALNLVVTWYKPEGKLGPEEIADAFLEFMGQGVLQAEGVLALVG
jgi:TetR/AcrR family transcriptional regulator, cholesterol catabolism regulator